jgi:hypothetical protein
MSYTKFREDMSKYVISDGRNGSPALLVISIAYHQKGGRADMTMMLAEFQLRIYSVLCGSQSSNNHQSLHSCQALALLLK